MCVGAYKALVRLIAALCTCILCLYAFSMLIVTPVYRFRPMGALTALCEDDTNVICTDVNDSSCVNSDWTYKKDGELILAIWIVQLIFCVFSCVGSICLTKPRTNNAM